MSQQWFFSLYVLITLCAHPCFSDFLWTESKNEFPPFKQGKNKTEEHMKILLNSEANLQAQNKKQHFNSSDSDISEPYFDNIDYQWKPLPIRQKRSLDMSIGGQNEHTSLIQDLVETTPLSKEADEVTFSTNVELITRETEVTTSESVSHKAENKENISVSDGNFELTSTTQASVESEDSSFTKMAMAKAEKLSEQIKQILAHYRKKGEVVVPMQHIFPEPMLVEDFKSSFSIGSMQFKNVTVYGLSNFTVEEINSDVDNMQILVLLQMKRLMVLGNYTLATFFTSRSAPFNLTLIDVESEGVAAVEKTSEGFFHATDSEMDMNATKMVGNFSDSLIDGLVSSVGVSLFNSIKPQILNRVNLIVRKDVNEKLKELSAKFASKVSPVSLALSEGRRYVREHGYDPLNIDHETYTVAGIIHINITDFTVQGLSSFHRVGNLSLSMVSGVIQFGIHVMTGKLSGGCGWTAEGFGIRRSGKTNFTVNHLQVRAYVNQSLDVRKKPQLESLDLHLGWVKVDIDSSMALHSMVQGTINAFPRLIKHMIVDTLEKPLKNKVQEILNKIDVESFVDINLPRLDNLVR